MPGGRGRDLHYQKANWRTGAILHLQVMLLFLISIKLVISSIALLSESITTKTKIKFVGNEHVAALRDISSIVKDKNCRGIEHLQSMKIPVKFNNVYTIKSKSIDLPQTTSSRDAPIAIRFGSPTNCTQLKCLFQISFPRIHSYRRVRSTRYSRRHRG